MTLCSSESVVDRLKQKDVREDTEDITNVSAGRLLLV